MEVVILSDNRVIMRPKGIKAEWGFSALIKAGETVLFDTGQTGIAFENLILLKERVPEKLVLSHGHYDHTGGIMRFIRSYDLEVYAHPHVFLPRWYRGEYVGIPFAKEEVLSHAKVFEFKEPIEVSKGVVALGEIPREYEVSLLSDSYILKDGKKVFDDIRDDQSLVVKTKDGLCLILGCCHSGIRNTVEYAEDVVGDEVKFLIGGLHLISFRGNKLLEIVDWLLKKFEWIAPCHCTGFMNEVLLSNKFGKRYKFIGAGSKLF